MNPKNARNASGWQVSPCECGNPFEARSDKIADQMRSPVHLDHDQDDDQHHNKRIAVFGHKTETRSTFHKWGDPYHVTDTPDLSCFVFLGSSAGAVVTPNKDIYTTAPLSLRANKPLDGLIA